MSCFTKIVCSRNLDCLTDGVQITEYVARPQELKRQLASNPQGSRSKFLEGFYTGAAGMSQGL